MARQLWPHNTGAANSAPPVQSKEEGASSSSIQQPIFSSASSFQWPWSVLMPDESNYPFHGSLFSQAALPPDMEPSMYMHQSFNEENITMEGSPSLQQKKVEAPPSQNTRPDSSLSSSSNDGKHAEIRSASSHGVSIKEEEEGGNTVVEKNLKQQEKPPRKKGQKRIRQPRIALVTKSEVEHLEDGYRWRKYGQKAVKNSPHPRSYYRCTNTKCSVKKRVELSSENPSLVITTYEDQHTHHIPASLRGSTETHSHQDVLPAFFNPLPTSFDTQNSLALQQSLCWPSTNSVQLRHQSMNSVQSMHSPPAPTSEHTLHRDQAAMYQQLHSASLLHESFLEEMFPFGKQNMS